MSLASVAVFLSGFISHRGVMILTSSPKCSASSRSPPVSSRMSRSVVWFCCDVSALAWTGFGCRGGGSLRVTEATNCRKKRKEAWLSLWPHTSVDCFDVRLHHRDTPKDRCTFRIRYAWTQVTDKRRPNGLLLTVKQAHYQGLVSDQHVLRMNRATGNSGLTPLTLDQLWLSTFETPALSPPAGTPLALQCR